MLRPENLNLLDGKLHDIALSEDIDLTQYNVYVHQLVVLANESHFGLGGGMTNRVENILLKFSINSKQRKSGDILFKNYILEEKQIHDGVQSYSMDHEICYTIPSNYFIKEQQFQNLLITFIRNSMRESFKKIKVFVAAKPTQLFLPLLKSSIAVDSFTNLDLNFTKACEYKSDIQLALNLPTEETIMDDEKGTTNIYNIGNASIVAPNGNVNSHNNTIIDQDFPIDHIIKELRHLKAMLEKEHDEKDIADDLLLIDEAIDKAANGEKFIPILKKMNSWVGDKAEKIGVSLVTAAIKGQMGL